MYGFQITYHGKGGFACIHRVEYHSSFSSNMCYIIQLGRR